MDKIQKWVHTKKNFISRRRKSRAPLTLEEKKSDLKYTYIICPIVVVFLLDYFFSW